jgi:hypothetical protein
VVQARENVSLIKGESAGVRGRESQESTGILGEGETYSISRFLSVYLIFQDFNQPAHT